MPRGTNRLFAGRGISLPSLRTTVAVVAVIVVAFSIGIAAGWGTSLFADRLEATSPTPSPSASPSPSETPTIDVSLPPMVPVVRQIDDADRLAGLRTLDFPIRGEGTFTPAQAPTTTAPDAEIVQYVRIDVEDGLKMTDGTLSAFVMGALNDPKGWGKEGPTTYVQTDGAPDIRIVFASPYTAALLCPTPHDPAALTPTATASPSPSASASVPAVSVQCATQGAIVVSIYDWIQGVPAYGDDRTNARVYFLSHGLGHVLGKADAPCAQGRATVMVDQQTMPETCSANPWPFPDAE